MTSFVAFVDRPVAIQLATGLIGSEVSVARQETTTAGINFKVMFTGSHAAGTTSSTKVESLLPEVLVDALRRSVPARASTLDDIRSRLLPGSETVLAPGTAVLLERATLSPPPDSDQTELTLMGEQCSFALLRSGDFDMRCFYSPEHESGIRPLFGQPLEILGILRFTQPYPAAGAVALNLGLRVVAAWMR